METILNCPAIRITENIAPKIPQIEVLAGWLVTVVTEIGAKLWSITLTGRESMEPAGKEAVFYSVGNEEQLA